MSQPTVTSTIDVKKTTAWGESGFPATFLGWKWDKTRRTDPARVSRHWLVLSVATLLALAYGARVEDAHDRRIAPGNLRTPPKALSSRHRNSWQKPKRKVSVFRRGIDWLRRLLLKGRLWNRVWLLPEPWPKPKSNLEITYHAPPENPLHTPVTPPPALSETQQAELEVAVQELPEAVGIGLANWNWRVVHRFVSERSGLSLCRSSCLNWLHRLGFAFKRPKKRLVNGNESKREAFVAEYAALWEEAQRTEARIFFADEAHFRADAELRGKWVLRGKPALVDSNSPRYGEKASYYSAVCLETGEVEWMELEGNSNSGTSVAFLTQLKEKHPGPLRVIWDNAPAHRGEAVREYLRTPELELRLVNPRIHEGRLCRATARTSTPMRLSGAGRERACPRESGGGHWQSVPGEQGGGAGEGRQIPGRAVQPERRGETAVPDRPAVKG